MDSERRHQLSQNALGNWLITQYEDVFKPNSQLIGCLLIAFIVFVCGFYFTVNTMKANAAKSWEHYFVALSSNDPGVSFQALIENPASASGPAAAQTRLTFAQILSGEADTLISSNRSQAVEKLEKSLQMFQAAQTLADNDGIRQQAAYGIAVAYETLAACRTDKNDLAEAEKKYKELADRWPNSLYGQRAKKQLDHLANPETRTFYEFVATAAPRTLPSDGFDGDIDTTAPFFDGPTDFDFQRLTGFDPAVPPRPVDDPEEKTDDNQDKMME